MRYVPFLVAVLVAGPALGQGTPQAPPPAAAPEVGRQPPPPLAPPPRDTFRPFEGGQPPDMRHSVRPGYAGNPEGGQPPDMRRPTRPGYAGINGDPPAFAASKGTFVHVGRDGDVTVRCAEGEPSKTCMEAVSPIIDKIKTAR